MCIRDSLAVDGVDALDALDDNAGLFLVQLGALEVALAGGLSLIGARGLCVPDGACLLYTSLQQRDPCPQRYISNRKQQALLSLPR